MQLWLVSTLPWWLSGILIVAACTVLAVVAQRAAGRRIPYLLREQHNELGGFTIAVVGAIYAVTLALVVVAVWEQRDAAWQSAEDEAASVSNLYRMAEGFHPAERLRVRDHLTTYVRAVVEDEWTDAPQGIASTRAQEAFSELWRAYMSIEPQSDRENAVFGSSLEMMRNASNLRQTRLLTNRTTLPPALWIALIAGYAITAGLMVLFGVKNHMMHSVMTASVAATIGLSLWLAFLMDAPYAGSLAVAPDAMRTALALFGHLGQ